MSDTQSQLEQHWNTFVNKNKIVVYGYEVKDEDLLEAKTAKRPFRNSGDLEDELEANNLQLVSDGHPEDGKYPITVKLKL